MLDDIDAPLASGAVNERDGMCWRIWYRRINDFEKWFMGTCQYNENRQLISFVKGKIAFDEEVGFMNFMRHMTVAEYKLQLDWGGMSECDPRKEDEYQSPHRIEADKRAAAEQKVLGEKRIETKYKNIKNVLEVGDVVHLPVSFKYRSKTGDTNFVAVILEVLGRQKYTVLTHAGPLARKIPRNDLILQLEMTSETLGIHPTLKNLPPISEGDALKLINPMRNDGVSCKCKNVSTMFCRKPPCHGVT